MKTASKRVGENLFTHKTSEAVSTKSMLNGEWSRPDGSLLFPTAFAKAAATASDLKVQRSTFFTKRCFARGKTSFLGLRSVVLVYISNNWLFDYLTAFFGHLVRLQLTLTTEKLDSIPKIVDFWSMARCSRLIAQSLFRLFLEDIAGSAWCVQKK